MRDFFHKIYKFFGHIFCRLFLVYWNLRDMLSPPSSDAVLFVAHPDDDTLFFHTFIKEHSPYVVLMTTGWSMRRLPCFFMAMKKYGVRFRAYDLESRDTRTDLLRKQVRQVVKIKHFSICATHNATGEYGHEMHCRVHNAVLDEMNCPLLVPVSDEAIGLFPLPDTLVAEKEEIFKKIYTTEIFVLDQYEKWVKNEHLEIYDS